MCGIAGVRRFGGEPITGEEIVLLLCSLEHRGKHATGIALESPDGIVVDKAALPAWNYTKTKAFNDFLEANLTPETTTALLHTRWATTGNPEFNENNHPMFDGDTAVVHNGMISNYQTLFTQGKYTKSCDTDSDIIRAIFDEFGPSEKGLREMNKMMGSAAIACLSTKYPDKLLLARSGSPLVYGFSDSGDKLYWASEPEAIITAAKPYRRVRGVWTQDTKVNISIGSMPDNTAWVFGPEEIELHHEFKTCVYYRKPDYSKGNDSYHRKTRDWKRELRQQRHVVVPVTLPKNERAINALKGAVIKCPGCGKGMENVHGKPWKELICSLCKTSLG